MIQAIVFFPLIGALVAVVVLAELLLVATAWVISPEVVARPGVPVDATVTNTQALGLVLYTRYVYFFEAAGVVLLVAMIGAIVMTLQHKPDVRRQRIAEQLGRTRARAIEVVKVRPGQGLP